MTGYTRHREVPVYEFRTATLDANRYHHAGRALRRMGPELSLPLPGLRDFRVIIQADAWIVADGAQGDIPVLAWCDFEPDAEGPLHRPVQCQLRLFHAHSDLLIERILDAIELLLGELLGDPGDRAGEVVPFGHD